MKFARVPLEITHLINPENLSDLLSEYSYGVLFNKTEKGWNTGIIAAFSNEKRSSDFDHSLRNNNGERFEFMFGHIGYNFKKFTEHVSCRFDNFDGFPDHAFFVPQILIRRNEENSVEIGYTTEEQFKLFTERIKHLKSDDTPNGKILLNAHLSKEAYIKKTHDLLRHIQRGDIYEVNFCQGFSAQSKVFNPAKAYLKLIGFTDAPFGALYKHEDSWLICGSPERYISRTGDTIISQPIKGTRKRSADPCDDEQLKEELKNDPKERSENVMIVDLVRNDLSRFALPGSVEVSELFGIYTFKTVHQMISTVRCKVSSETTNAEIFLKTFPMGSMTGAPKRRAIELAEQCETQSRGIYSGTVGVISPDGDFDFNVVIRSITWNAKTGYLSVMAGSAITSLSVPETEYEECMLKLEAMKRVIESA
jgi:para-aminobenzoate synthetase component 1